ncbi:MAG TPA: glycosyltransferase family 4 protein, partial [Patescibacteria group bacterium]|nr:glycosyltransferase family 4 protein [Patescibacteria group bacterium]
FKQSKKAFNPLRNLIIRHYLKYATKIFSVSAELKKALEYNKIQNIATIHNAIDVNDWAVGESEAKEFKKELGLEHKKIILFAGRLSGYKGTQETMAAMEQVAKNVPGATLLVLDTQNNYRQANPNIYLAGAVARDKMKYYYAICDLVIVPSVCFDSFPTVNLEAFACHRPVIATIFGGSRELVEDQKTGYLINPLHIDELAEKIIYLLTNPEIARTMGENGYQKVKTEFNQEKWLKEILGWY